MTTISKVGLLLAILSLCACSYNSTVGSQKVYKISVDAKEDSTVCLDIPVSAQVETEAVTTQDTASDAKATPDAVSTVTGAVGALLTP